MTKYKVVWAEEHSAIVEEVSEYEAEQKAFVTDNTFVKVIGDAKTEVFKTRQVTWIEHHICEVVAADDTGAIKEAAYYASEHDTCGDRDHYEVMEA